MRGLRTRTSLLSFTKQDKLASFPHIFHKDDRPSFELSLKINTCLTNTDLQNRFVGTIIRMMATNALSKVDPARSTLRNQEREMSSLRTHLYDLATLELNNRIVDLTRSIRNCTLGLMRAAEKQAMIRRALSMVVLSRRGTSGHCALSTLLFC
jgi:hypothetical protein